MGSGGAGDQGVCSVDRPAALLVLGLVTTGSRGRFARRLEKPKATQQVVRSSPFLRSDATFDLRNVHATRPERVALGQQVEQESGRHLAPPEVGDEDGRVEQVRAQAGDSVRRDLRTQAEAVGRSCQCR